MGDTIHGRHQRFSEVSPNLKFSYLNLLTSAGKLSLSSAPSCSNNVVPKKWWIVNYFSRNGRPCFLTYLYQDQNGKWPFDMKCDWGTHRKQLFINRRHFILTKTLRYVCCVSPQLYFNTLSPFQTKETNKDKIRAKQQQNPNWERIK